MTTCKQRKAAIVVGLRKHYGKDFVVRKSWHYAMMQCRECHKVFQVAFQEPAYTYALEVINAHKCGPRLVGYQKISQG